MNLIIIIKKLNGYYVENVGWNWQYASNIYSTNMMIIPIRTIWLLLDIFDRVNALCLHVE